MGKYSLLTSLYELTLVAQVTPSLIFLPQSIFWNEFCQFSLCLCPVSHWVKDLGKLLSGFFLWVASSTMAFCSVNSNQHKGPKIQSLFPWLSKNSPTLFELILPLQSARSFQAHSQMMVRFFSFYSFSQGLAMCYFCTASKRTAIVIFHLVL